MSESDQGEHFLGSLRSELDEGEDSLHPYFVALYSAADTIRVNYISWKLRSAVAAQLFQTLKIVDIDGREWTVGAVTGGWFRRDGSKSTWIASMPPTGVTPNLSDVPAWYSKGMANLVAEHLADSGTVLQEDSDTHESYSVNQEGGLAVANPFQTQEVTRLNVGEEIRNAITSDTDWLFEEWENSRNGESTALETGETPGSEASPAEKFFLPPEDNE